MSHASDEDFTCGRDDARSDHQKRDAIDEF
jgi:hypothetical protein